MVWLNVFLIIIKLKQKLKKKKKPVFCVHLLCARLHVNKTAFPLARAHLQSEFRVSRKTLSK